MLTFWYLARLSRNLPVSLQASWILISWWDPQQDLSRKVLAAQILRFRRHLSDISMRFWPAEISPCGTKLEDDWLKPFNKRQLVLQNRTKLFFNSTTFDMLNGIFQSPTLYNKMFNICWTAVTFVAHWTVYHYNCCSGRMSTWLASTHPQFASFL